MSDANEQTPSQAEGEREPENGTADGSSGPDTSGAPRTTPSQAEGDRSEGDGASGTDTA
ncbi:hypothetical protein [Streptomyces sp.]|uniref:hypothetical protein n=1 Tax=Streptomyces sp. TaxID=1931 RepID=UPI002810AE3D|nr:hypothetical protein [Streptomyces sp.]